MKPYIAFFILSLFFFNCNQSKKDKLEDPSIGLDTAPIEARKITNSFDLFLENFVPDTDFSEWVDQCQTPLVLNGDIFNDQKINKTLPLLFSKIPTSQVSYIPTKDLVQLVPDVPKTIKPDQSFDFYGFKQIE